MNLRPPKAQQRYHPAASNAIAADMLQEPVRPALPSAAPSLPSYHLSFWPIKFPPSLSSCPHFFIQLLQNGKLIPKFGSI